jgi:RHS repeat-associated protein
MKRQLLFLLFLNVFWSVHSQTTQPSQDQNYIRKRIYTQDDGSAYLDAVQYYDGLGRPSELVQVGITPDKADLVIYQEYDNLGRKSKSWLPAIATSNNGAFVDLTTFQSNATATYNNTLYNSSADAEPYTYPVYENSPLNRITEQYGAGETWHNDSKAVKTAYLTNGATTIDIPYFTTADDTKTVSITRSGNYAPNTLYVTELTDEDGNLSYEAKDKFGQVVCTAQKNGATPIYTSYVYDAFGNKRAMIPPEAVSRFSSGTWTEDTQTLKDYVYVYKYDARRRMIAKQIPGSDWTYYVYDKADRLIFSQDGEQRAKEQWLFIIPDVFGRTVMTGTCTNSMNYADNPLENTVVTGMRTNANDIFKGYAIAGVVTYNFMILSVNYYDDYHFRGYNGISNEPDFSCEAIEGYGTQYTKNYQGLLTGTMSAILDDNTSPTAYLYSIFYYDSKDRLIQSKSTNHLTGGVDKEYFLYDFTGHLLKRKTVHAATDRTTQTELYTYTYDHVGRQLTAQHQLNDNQTMLLSNNQYDELGRLKTIAHAPPQSLPLSAIPVNSHIRGRIINTKEPTTLSINYRYNIRNRLSDIDSNPFTEKLTYTPGGNVYTMDWNQGGDRKYTFDYDNLSRLKTATFSEGRPNEKFSTAYQYDKHGNMIHLRRYGQTEHDTYGIVDDLTYSYNNSNQVRNITDAGPNVMFNNSPDFKDYTKGDGTEYDYNANGSMIKDMNKGISSMTYNILNLPRKMDIKSPVAEAHNEYIYSASGRKLKVIQQWKVPVPTQSADPDIKIDILPPPPQAKTIDYVGNKIYEDGVLKMMLTDNGYFDCLENKYYFYIRDHLGNNRIVTDLNSNIVQSTQYYPFGMPMNISTGQDKQPYKFGGKEFDPKFGLNMSDFVARGLDPATGQFTTNDPLAEKYPWISPRAFCANNPINRIDPMGLTDYPVAMYHDILPVFNPEEDTILLDEVVVTGKGGGGGMYSSFDARGLGLLNEYASHSGYDPYFEMDFNTRWSNLMTEWSDNTTSHIVSSIGNITSASSALAGAASATVYNEALGTWMGKNGKFYSMNWGGNGYTGGKLQFANNLGSSLKFGGYALGGISILNSGYQFNQSTTIEGRVEHGLDMFMGGMGFVPGAGTAVSAFWSFGGKQLHWNHVNDVVMPAIQMGLPPYSYLPFK